MKKAPPITNRCPEQYALFRVTISDIQINRLEKTFQVDLFIPITLKEHIYSLHKNKIKVDDIKLYLIGDRPDKNKLQSYVYRDKLTDRACSTGRTNNQEIMHCFQASHLSSPPSYNKGTAYLLLETNSYGRPVTSLTVCKLNKTIRRQSDLNRSNYYLAEFDKRYSKNDYKEYTLIHIAFSGIITFTTSRLVLTSGLQQIQ